MACVFLDAKQKPKVLPNATPNYAAAHAHATPVLRAGMRADAYAAERIPSNPSPPDTGNPATLYPMGREVLCKNQTNIKANAFSPKIIFVAGVEVHACSLAPWPLHGTGLGAAMACMHVHVRCSGNVQRVLRQ